MLPVRLLATGLSLTWAALGLLFLAGLAASPVHLPMTLVAVVPSLTALVAALRPRRAVAPSAVQLLLGLLALLVSLPTVLLLAEPLLAAGRAPRTFSLEVVYAGVVSFGLSLLFAVCLLLPRRQALLLSGTATAAAGLAALVAAVGGSPAGIPTACTVPHLAQASQVRLVAVAEVDGRQVGQVELRGERTAAGETWTAMLSGTAGERTVSRPAGGTQTLEGRVVDLLAAGSLLPAENLGVERLNDEPARHCRLMIDGDMATQAFPPLAWLAGGEAPPAGRESDAPPLDVWRGDLNWWVGRDGRLLRADVLVGGHPADAWGKRALRGLLAAQLSVADASPSAGQGDALP